MSLDVAFRVRATRAHPPGRAAKGERRGTYGGALAQFDELIAAATSSSPASRPLPLFYALSQAGRAIVAAHADRAWRLRSHGLTAPDLSGPLLEVEVRPSPAASPNTIDSFSGVAAATGVATFGDAVTVGSLWSSLPEGFQLLPERPGTAPLLLAPDGLDGDLVPWGHVRGTIVGFDQPPDQLVAHLEAHFPTTEGVRLHQPQGLPHILVHHTDYGPGVQVWWEADSPNVAGHLRTLQRVAPEGDGFDAAWLRPAVGGVALSPLLTWWALLFGLSMLARYEPAGWVAALDYDASELAAPLGGVLDVGLERVPELVLAALLQEPAATPEA